MAADAQAAHVEVDGRTLKLTNLDKVMYRATETTKGEVLHYYAALAPRLLRQLDQRPVTRVRFPHGVGDLQFFEKNTPPGMPTWIRTFAAADGVTYPLIDDTAALTYFANLASLEFHTPQWRVDGPSALNPDRMVIDLDPGAPAGLDECAQVAVIIKDFCDSMNWTSVPVTSGSKGMQIYIALDGAQASDEVKALARAIADQLAKAAPDLVVSTMTKSQRAGKVFLDWSQNSVTKTTITPWSLRGRNRPFVATPRRWDEVIEGAAAPGVLAQLDMDDVLADRLGEPDPMDALADI